VSKLRVFFARLIPRKYWQAGCACLLLVLMLGANASAGTAVDEARFGRIGHQMICTCSCGQILLECNHVSCPDSPHMIAELREQLSGPNAAGADSLIENVFVAKYGATVLAAPMRGGFDNVAWIVPMVLFVLATLGTALVVRAWARRHAPLQAAPAAPPVDSSQQDALRERIRRETEY
jgi:cytochrome c-type biogenesis protein CcmH